MKYLITLFLIIWYSFTDPIVLYPNKTPDSMNGSDYEMRSLYIYGCT